MKNELSQAVEELKKRVGDPFPQAAMMLGSGWSGIAEALEDPVTVPYAELEGIPAPRTPGHAARVVAGRCGGRRVLCFLGRCHPHEGWSWWETTAPIRLAAACGVRTILLTNAAGGIREDLVPGRIMVIDDHINLTGGNPLTALPPEGGSPFVDMTDAYDPSLRSLLDLAAKAAGVTVAHGIYAAVAGPTYETPAEVRMLRRLGADAVGMSTVGETIMARKENLQTLGISCITNRAAGLAETPLSHDEVLEVVSRTAKELVRLLTEMMRRIP